MVNHSLEVRGTRSAAYNRLVNHRLALGVAVAIIVVVTIAPHALFRGRVFPGVSVGATPVGTLALEQAEERIAGFGGQAATTNVAVRDPLSGRTWQQTAGDLGFAVDVAESVRQAMAFGRSGVFGWLFGPWRAVLRGAEVPPAWQHLLPISPTLQSILDAATVPPTNARLEEGGGQVRAVPASSGQTVDVAASLDAIASALSEQDPHPVDLRLSATGARLGSVEDVALAWEVIQSSPLRITWQGEILAQIPVETLRSWFQLTDATNAEGDVVPSIEVDRDAIHTQVSALAPMVQRAPRDPRFALDRGTAQARVADPGQTGASLDIPHTVDRVIEGAYTRQRVAEVAADLTPSRLAAEDAASLSGATLVAEAWTLMRGSPPGREQNVRAAAAALQGLALAPGQETSLLAALGPVSPETGYAMPYLRPQPEGAPGWTGGLEQVATGYFRAAVWGGLGVFERYAPPIRVGWLEPPIGLDAAVQAPDTDLRIANATSSYLLFLNVIDDDRAALGVQLFAQPALHPNVALAGPDVAAITPPGDPITRTDVDIAAGGRLTVGWAREGASVHISRSVSMPGGPTFSDAFDSLYAPASEVTAVGPR